MASLCERNVAALTMAVLILAVIGFSGVVSASSTPVSVDNGENATFSWFLPVSARGKLVKVVNPAGQPVLDWAPDCAVTPSSFYAHRIHASCKDASWVTFTLLGVTWSDEGSYTCRAVTSSGPQIEDCGQNLTLVKVPPKVHIELTTPDTVAMKTGEKYLTLTCVVTEATPPVPEDGYSWSYLPSSQGQLQPLRERTSTLTLGPLTTQASGQYFCQARNDPDNRMASYALNTSCIDALLHSDVSPKAVVEKDRDGYRAVFELAQHPRLILVQHPNTYIITDWHSPCNFSVTDAFKDRVTDTSCDPCRGTLSFSLVNVTTRDLGWYQCYAGTTHSDRIDSCSVELISKVPIQVHIKPGTPDAVVKGAEGNPLTLTCVVTEALPPVPEDGYSWRYLPSPQGQLRPLVGNTNTLTLDPLTRRDNGQYFCQARNDLTNGGKILPGMASVTVDVSYLGQIQSTSDLKVNEGDHVNVTCSVDSKPTARLAWVVEGQEVRHVTANEIHYMVESAACSDSKTYTCRAANPDLPGREERVCITLTVSCGQAQTSDGHERWQTTTIVLVVVLAVILVVAAGVIVYCIRRQGRMSSKNSLQDNPGKAFTELQQIDTEGSSELTQVLTTDTTPITQKSSKAVQTCKKLDEELADSGDEDTEDSSELTEVHTTDTPPRTQKSSKAVQTRKKLDEELSDSEDEGAEGSSELTVLLTTDTPPRTQKSSKAVQTRKKPDKESVDPEDEAREGAMSPPQASTTGTQAKIGQPTEAVDVPANFGAQGDSLIDLQVAKESQRRSGVSNSDRTPSADKSSETVEMRGKLDEEGATGPLHGVAVSKGSVRRSQDSTAAATLGAEIPSAADQTRTESGESESDSLPRSEGNGNTA